MDSCNIFNVKYVSWTGSRERKREDGQFYQVADIYIHKEDGSVIDLNLFCDGQNGIEFKIKPEA